MKDKIRIVWVDDEFDDQVEFIEDCEEANIEFKKFRSKNAALDEIRRFHRLYDLFLLDAEILKDEDDEPNTTDEKYSRQLREEINEILPEFKPILVRTGRINSTKHYWYYDIFKSQNVFNKNQDSQIIIDAILKNVKNSPRVVFEKEYFLLMGILEKYFDNETIKIFIDLHVTTDKENHEYRYNTLRKLFEIYIRKLNELKYLPDYLGKKYVNIKGSSLFLSGIPTNSKIPGKVFILNQESVFSNTSKTLITFLSNIFNEQSHTRSNYYSHVNEVPTTSLFESCYKGLIELYVYTFKHYINKVSKEKWKLGELKEINN
jgi:hypothetical protein